MYGRLATRLVSEKRRKNTIQTKDFIIIGNIIICIILLFTERNGGYMKEIIVAVWAMESTDYSAGI
jgi:hypothetical protein